MNSFNAYPIHRPLVRAKVLRLVVRPKTLRERQLQRAIG
eukprot:COSAG02_NODE_1465_length_12485_cov_9.526804_9_plen_39_part_00